jgi:hypothetical protein
VIELESRVAFSSRSLLRSTSSDPPHMVAYFVGSHACAVALQRPSAGFWKFGANFQVKFNSVFMQALNNQVMDTIKNKKEPAENEWMIKSTNGAAIVINFKNKQKIVDAVQAAPADQQHFKNCLLGLPDELSTYRGRKTGYAISF